MENRISSRAVSLLKEWYFRTREANCKTCYPPISTTWAKRGLAWEQVGVGFDQSRGTSPRELEDWQEAGHQFCKLHEDIQCMIVAHLLLDMPITEIAKNVRVGQRECKRSILAGMLLYESLCIDAGLIDVGDILRHRYLSGLKAIAQYLGINTRTARRWAENSGLPVRKVRGGSILGSTREIDEWFLSTTKIGQDGGMS